MPQKAWWWNELPATKYIQTEGLSAHLVHYGFQSPVTLLSPSPCPASWAWPQLTDPVTCWCCLGNWPQATAAGWWIQAGDPGWALWPPRGLAKVRERGCCSLLFGWEQDRLILILSNTARATWVRENPRGSLYNVIFWKHKCLKCFLAWNERILCTAPPPRVLLRFQAGGPSSALSSTEGLSAKGNSKGGAGPESSARSSRPPACEDTAAILNMSNSLVQLQVFARGSAHALVIYTAV